jgi:alpha-glucosidase (family GH31 glycosyl hydrolase)
MRDLHMTMINRYLGKPIDIPDQRMIMEPIWSTWAQFKQEINKEKILKYAEEIVNQNFPRSQICIDDNWTPHYVSWYSEKHFCKNSFFKGTLDFDKKKFPNPKQMITKLKELNFRVTLWIHPFISCKSFRFIDYYRRGLLINMNILSSLIDLVVERSHFLQLVFDDFLSNPQFQPMINLIKYIYQRFFFSLPGISLWWNGLAGVLDLTNESTCQEYSSSLQRLQKLYDIDSFKFDAGEVNWLPKFGAFVNPSCQQMSIDKTTLVTTPALYPYLYAQLACRIDADNRLQEVRVGYRTQTLPVFVRIIDKDSNWSANNGLRSLLPSIFNLSLLGYPFILPDMVCVLSFYRK